MELDILAFAKLVCSEPRRVLWKIRNNKVCGEQSCCSGVVLKWYVRVVEESSNHVKVSQIYCLTMSRRRKEKEEKRREKKLIGLMEAPLGQD